MSLKKLIFTKLPNPIRETIHCLKFWAQSELYSTHADYTRAQNLRQGIIVKTSFRT